MAFFGIVAVQSVAVVMSTVVSYSCSSPLRILRTRGEEDGVLGEEVWWRGGVIFRTLSNLCPDEEGGKWWIYTGPLDLF